MVRDEVPFIMGHRPPPKTKNMKKIYLTLIACLLFTGTLKAQLTFIVDSLPEYTPTGDQLYLAGTPNGWDPGDPSFALQKNEDEKWWITLESQPEGTYIEFKFTRGDWGKVEKGPSGEEIPNRSYTYGNGDTVYIVIYNWADHSGGNSTAAENVLVMDEDFYIPQLDRERRIWIYLPPGYETSGISYPVLYMHDGQNLFDAATSFLGEWEVDETLNELWDEGYLAPIVVGIDNGGEHRLAEYTPWAHPMHGGGDGDLYMDFIVQTLKPYVDANYRTMPGREHTGIMGSSLGGLISHYGLLQYQDVFSKAGVYSPSYWFSDTVWSFTSESGHQLPVKVYLMCGSLEGAGTVSDMLDMQDTLIASGFGDEEIFIKVIPGGEHNEILWRGDFGEAYLWLFGSYASDIHENKPLSSFEVFPNPVTDQLVLPESLPLPCGPLKIISIAGTEVLSLPKVNNRIIEVNNLKPGIYLVFITCDKQRYQARFVVQ